MLTEKSIEASENLFDFPQIEPESNTDNKLIVEEISRELEEFLLSENDNADSTNVVSSSWQKYQIKFGKTSTNYSAKISTKNDFLNRSQKYLPCF